MQHIVAIGTPTWNDHLQSQIRMGGLDGYEPDTRVTRTGAPLVGYRFLAENILIQPDLDQQDPNLVHQIRMWVSMDLYHKFGPGEHRRATQIFLEHRLLTGRVLEAATRVDA